MAVISSTELVTRLQELIPDNTTDTYIALIEDIHDTLPENPVDWEQRYNDLDKSWRKRYTERFMGKVDTDVEMNPEPTKDPDRVMDTVKPLTYESLFKRKE